MKISEIKINPSNPRFIKDEKFTKLVKSIKEFPKMMELRPIIIDDDNIILGGNMRYRALKELKYKEIPDNWVKRATELTDEEKRRFIIEDNVPFGEWDFDMLSKEWDENDLIEWGVEMPFDTQGDIVELPEIITTYNINIKCESPEEFEEMKSKLNITSKQISASQIKLLLS